MVFLDSNILLEIILKGRTKRTQVESFLKAVDEPTAISMLSVHLIMHFSRKTRINEEFLQGVIGENEILGLMPEDYGWALVNEKQNDFEDALQMAVAVRAGCSSFVTLDRKLTKAYIDAPIPVTSI